MVFSYVQEQIQQQRYIELLYSVCVQDFVVRNSRRNGELNGKFAMERGPCGTARKPVPSKFETKTEFFDSNGLKRMIFFCQNFSYTISACVSYGFLVFEADYIMKIMKIGLARPRVWIVLDFLFVYDIFPGDVVNFFFGYFASMFVKSLPFLKMLLMMIA